jgi:uncharacterized RDD family membrane protein YckC
MLLFIGGLGMVEIIMMLLFVLLPIILFIWALIDVLRSDFKDSITKVIWVIVVIFVPLVGPILYLVLRKGQKVDSSYRF